MELFQFFCELKRKFTTILCSLMLAYKSIFLYHVYTLNKLLSRDYIVVPPKVTTIIFLSFFELTVPPYVENYSTDRETVRQTDIHPSKNVIESKTSQLDIQSLF